MTGLSVRGAIYVHAGFTGLQHNVYFARELPVIYAKFTCAIHAAEEIHVLGVLWWWCTLPSSFSLLPTWLANCLSACAPGVVSAHREVAHLAGMGTVLKSPRTAAMLVSYTRGRFRGIIRSCHYCMSGCW